MTRYRIDIPDEIWEHFGPELLAGIVELSTPSVVSPGESFEVWNPSNPRQELMPDLIVDPRRNPIWVDDLDGRPDKLLKQVDEVLARFNARHGCTLRRRAPGVG